MAEKIGTTIVVRQTAAEACEECGAVAELRPYGVGGKKICVGCGMKDPEGTQARMVVILTKQLEGTTHVVLEEGVIGERGATLHRGHLGEDLEVAMTDAPADHGH